MWIKKSNETSYLGLFHLKRLTLKDWKLCLLFFCCVCMRCVKNTNNIKQDQSYPLSDTAENKREDGESNQTDQERKHLLWLPVLQWDPIHLLQLISFMDQAFKGKWSHSLISLQSNIMWLDTSVMSSSAHRFYQPHLLSWSSPPQ